MTDTIGAFGVTVDASGNLNFDGLVNNVADAIAGHAPQAVKTLIALAADESAHAAELGVATTSTVEVMAEIAPSLAAAGPEMALFVAAAGVMYDLHNIVEAGIRTDCCKGGSDPRWGSCGDNVKANYSWYGLQGQGGRVAYSIGDPRMPVSSDGKRVFPTSYRWKGRNAAEDFVGQAVIAAHDSVVDCRHNFPSASLWTAALANAVAAWNATHEPYEVITAQGQAIQLPNTIERTVNVYFGASEDGQSRIDANGYPDDPLDPISVALNAGVVLDTQGNWNPPARSNQRASFTLHQGGRIGTVAAPTLNLGAKPVMPSSGATAAHASGRAGVPMLPKWMQPSATSRFSTTSPASASAFMAQPLVSLARPAAAPATQPWYAVIIPQSQVAAVKSFLGRQVPGLGGMTVGQTAQTGGLLSAMAWAIGVLREGAGR